MGCCERTEVIVKSTAAQPKLYQIYQCRGEMTQRTETTRRPLTFSYDIEHKQTQLMSK